ncbi:hypothetical protein BVRB_5g104640 [Beta vulgaris subsp. vulgaris]|nr:hypothetical protein BVRB_5g104640 [Beta vulgaris subsp. vulgaris]
MMEHTTSNMSYQAWRHDPQYFPRIPGTYSQEMIDELRDMWVNYLNNQTQDDGD